MIKSLCDLLNNTIVCEFYVELVEKKTHTLDRVVYLLEYKFGAACYHFYHCLETDFLRIRSKGLEAE